MPNESVTKDELLSFLENEVKFRIDTIVESAIEMAEEVHAGVKREDGASSFLQTHTWPVTLEVIKHYQSENKLLTSLQIAGAILHDFMEDDEKILDLYASKTYGFDAYFLHRFGDYVYKMIMAIKLADRLNNMRFVAEIPGNEKIQRYIREAEDFYIAYPLLAPRMDNFYSKIRTAYEDLKKIKISA